MSATLEPGWLETIDYIGKFPGNVLELSAEDYDPEHCPLYKKMTADKKIEPLGVTATEYGKYVAREVLKQHLAGTQTLVVLNTVKRAKAVYSAIKKSKASPEDVLLVHSRFRPKEREMLNDQVTAPGKDRIIVATQVVEAGVDISARTLISELAPWASVVQRIGRCNRTGDDGPGQVFWIDLDTDKQAGPYEAADLLCSREQLKKLEGKAASPKKRVEDHKRDQRITLPFTHTHVLRRRDLIDLFDTTTDLSGNDVDVSRFVRGDDPDADVQVFWRSVGASRLLDDERSPHRCELCNVPIGEIKAFLEKGEKRAGYAWDHFDEDWRKIKNPNRELRPGMSILLPTEAGGYSTLGWDADSPAVVIPVDIDSIRPAEGTGSDPNSCGPALTIAVHTQHVCEELACILKGVGDLPDQWLDHLSKAARRHDHGKAHDAFQQGMRRANPTLDPSILWAKSGNNCRLCHGRKYFRHELASALAALQHELPFEVAYLMAAHHGKIRLSIR